MLKKYLFLFFSLFIITLICIFGYYKYTCHRYVEIALDYKETIYKATIISCNVVNSVQIIRERNNKYDKALRQSNDQNEISYYYGQIMENNRRVNSIIKKGNVILEDLVKRAYVDFDEMKNKDLGYKDEQKLFEKIHELAKPLINNCKRGIFPHNIAFPYEKEKNYIIDMLEESDHSIGAISKDVDEFCNSKTLEIHL